MMLDEISKDSTVHPESMFLLNSMANSSKAFQWKNTTVNLKVELEEKQGDNPSFGFNVWQLYTD